MMQDLVQQMIENIERTASLYEQILATERDKQRAIVASDAEVLAEIVAREEKLMGIAAHLEAERTDLRARLAGAHEHLGPASRLRHLIDVLDGPERDRLAEKRRHLLSLAGQINEVNRLNFQLLRCSIDLLSGILDEVFGVPAAPPTYNASGRQEPAARGATRVDQLR